MEYDIPIVNFGNKYNGQPLTNMLTDKDYCDFVIKQGFIKHEKHKAIYNILVNQQIYDPKMITKTPAHNDLQNKFLNKNIQEKLIDRIFPKSVEKEMENLKNLLENEEFIKCFGKMSLPEFNHSSARFTPEDKFNWDFVLSVRVRPSFTFSSIEENEINEKIEYKKKYDHDEQQKFIKVCEDYDNKISKREKENKEKKEKYEEDMKNYLQNKETNEKQVTDYERLKKKYEEKRKLHESEKIKEICKELKISVFEYDKLSTYSNEKKTIQLRVAEETRKYCLENKPPQEVRKISMPTIVTSDGYSFHTLEAQKKRYIEEYNKNYERTFEEHYDKMRMIYYSNLLKCNGFITYIKKNNNKYQINLTICSVRSEFNICAELKPTLGEDYPGVLRKMKTQKELTQKDISKGSKFEDNCNIYCLIIEKFDPHNTTIEQLFRVFSSANILVIFAKELFDVVPHPLQIKDKEVDRLKLLEDENRVLREANKKLEEENKQLLEENRVLREGQNTKKHNTITNYFVKKN